MTDAPHCLVEQDGHKLTATGQRRRLRPGLHPHRRRRLLLRGHGPEGRDQEVAGRELQVGLRPVGDQGPAQGLPAHEAADRRRRGAGRRGGTEILQGTDIRIAGESARFGVAEARWSLYPMGGSAVRLPRQIPYTVALDLLLTGRLVSAPEAKEVGLIGHVVPDGEALAKAHEIADLICANGPLAVQAILRTVRDSEAGTRRSAGPATPRSAWPSSPPRTPRRGRGPSPRSGSRSSRGVSHPGRPAHRYRW